MCGTSMVVAALWGAALRGACGASLGGNASGGFCKGALGAKLEGE